MKILFITSGSIRGNFTYRALSLARELQKINYQTTIISPKADKYNNFVPEKIDKIDGVRILQPFQFLTKQMEINFLPYIFSALLLVLKEKPDLVYIYKPTPISIVGFVVKIFRKTPVIIDMDDLGSEVMKIEGYSKFHQKLVKWSEQISIKYATRIVVASSYLFLLFQKKFPQKPIHLMPNGADDRWFLPVILSKKKKRIIFLGSLNRRNILEPLLDVFPDIIKKHPDVEALIIGDGRYFAYFKEKSERLGIKNHMRFTGWLSEEKVRENLQAGDIGYNYMPNEPTIKAASNMKMPQYMSRGLVPIISDVGDLPAMVSFGEVGYICQANNLFDLKRNILIAIEDLQRLDLKSKMARSFAWEKFHWKNLAVDFDDWLKNKIVDKKTSKKKIYIVATSFPFNTGGAKIRNLNLIKQLQKNSDYEISLFCIARQEDIIDIKKMETDLGVKLYVFRKPFGSIFSNLRAFAKRMQPFMVEYCLSGLASKFQSVCETEIPDIVQIEQIDAYYCLRSQISVLKKNKVKIILDAHNIEAEAFLGAMRTFSFFKKNIGRFLLSPLTDLEIEAAKKCDAVFACSEKDADYFKKYNNQTYIIPNGVDCARFIPFVGEKEIAIVFIGGVKYPPNADALKFYLNEIHPKIKNIIPNIKVFAIGATKEWLSKNQSEDISVIPLGFVEDIKPYLDKAILGICPIRQGSGTRLKVLTFMASGLPVVATAKGAEGLLFTDKQDIIIADSAELFAEKAVALLNNRIWRKFIGDNARELAQKIYDWNIIGKKLRTVYKEIIKNRL